MRVLGIDLGSREVKVAVMENNKIVEMKKYSTVTFYRNYCEYEEKIMVDVEKLNIGKVDYAVSTGYGRNNTDLKSFVGINELKAHAYGAMYQSGLEDFTLLDVGGQDIKVQKVEKGVVTDLDLNDKCAASCGRYLENMAAILEVELDYLSGFHADPIELNSTCAVFSESELIGKIAEGHSTEVLCASINHSLFKKLLPLLTKFPNDKLVISGGVAKNQGFCQYFEEEFKEVIKLSEPQYNGAIGCCYYGMNILGKRGK